MSLPALCEALGVDGVPPPPTMELRSSFAAQGFVRHLVQLVGVDGDAIPAYLAVPDGGGGPFPAVVLFHQHAGQRHLGKSEAFGLAGDPFQSFGPALAQAGFVVLAPDAIAFEDHRAHAAGTDPHPLDAVQHYNELAYRLVVGETLMSKVLTDAMACVSALLARPDVDPDRLGALGHSFGGSTVLFLAAVDPRVRYACASGALCSYRKRVAEGTGIEMAQVIPGFAARFDIEDLLVAIAPRKLFAVSATEDKYSADADELVTLAAPAFAQRGSQAHLVHRRFTGAHALDQQRFDAIVEWIISVGGGSP